MASIALIPAALAAHDGPPRPAVECGQPARGPRPTSAGQRVPLAERDAICHSPTMWKSILILVALCLPLPALAGMSADEFDRLTKGKTLFYSLNGTDYGVERYYYNRRAWNGPFWMANASPASGTRKTD